MTAIIKEEVLSFVATWVKLADVTLNKINQVEKDKCCMFSVMLIAWKESRLEVTKDQEGSRCRVGNMVGGGGKYF